MSNYTDTLNSYASLQLLQQLKKTPNSVLEPFMESYQAAVLFSDISGFTKLTERLTAGNPGGIVDLAEILDIYIGQLVNIVTEHGGDIVKFAGDALFAVWRASDSHSLAEMVYRATVCGMNIQRQLVNFEVKKGIQVSLRVGIGAGSLSVFQVGGLFDRWEIVFAGPAMNQVNRAGKIANSGEVVISSHVQKELEQLHCGEKDKDEKKFHFRSLTKFLPHCSGKKEEVQLSPAVADMLRSYIPRAILSRIDDDLDPAQADLRQVAVIFLKVGGFQFSKKRSLEKIQKIMCLMQKSVYHFEGSINRFGVDEKGAILLAAFGLPPLDHDDDALRAVYAAQDLREQFKNAGRECVIGIGTGRVFCGSVGNELRREYTMHGSVVNLAASLMQASDSIYCDETTYENARHKIKFEKLEPLFVKGRTEAVNVFRPL